MIYFLARWRKIWINPILRKKLWKPIPAEGKICKSVFSQKAVLEGLKNCNAYLIERKYGSDKSIVTGNNGKDHQTHSRSQSTVEWGER